MIIRFLRFLLRWLPWVFTVLFLYWLFTEKIYKSEVVENKDSISHFMVLQKIENIGKLELVKYNFKDIVELNEKNAPYLGFFEVPDSKVVLITSGEAVGCIDLKKIKATDIYTTKDTVLIKLPEPELCYYKLDMGKSKIYSVEKQVYFKEEGKMIEKAYRKAELQMKKSALESGILEQTASNAEGVLRPLLESASGKKVIFTTQVPEAVYLKKL